MNITLSIEDEIVKKVRKIALENNTTLTGLVREYLKSIASEDDSAGRKRRREEGLKRSFELVALPPANRDWRREDLYDRGHGK